MPEIGMVNDWYHNRQRDIGPLTVSLLIFDEQKNKMDWFCAFLVGAMWVSSGNISVLMLVKEVKTYIVKHKKFKFQHILITT